MTESTGKTQDQTLKYLYDEYVRLSTRLDEITDSSWNDFNLLGAIGAIILWTPLTRVFQSTEEVADCVAEVADCTSKILAQIQMQHFVLLIGFIGITFVIGVIGTRDLLKGAVMRHYIEELKKYEAAINEFIPSSTTFHSIRNWDEEGRRRWAGVYLWFNVLFILFLLLFPTGILWILASVIHALIYLGVSLIILVIYVIALRALG